MESRWCSRSLGGGIGFQPGHMRPRSRSSVVCEKARVILCNKLKFDGKNRWNRSNVLTKVAENVQPISYVVFLGMDMSSLVTLAYEPVVLPCSSMNCGDIVYRSTLDPVLRMEQRVLSPQGLALLSASLLYLLSKPGVLQGMVDTYVSAPIQRFRTPAYCLDDVKVGKRIAAGGFGTVYRGELIGNASTQRPVILKKATEFGEAEVWMNERIMRASPQVAARFITGFPDSVNPKPGDPLWLMWEYEGDSTLAELMKSRNFPENMEEILFNKPLKLSPGPNRRAVAIRVAMLHLLESLKVCHGNGLVHRDVKPQNFILAKQERRFKLIDFGAAADLRVGINYVPNQYLLDPRYAPPEQYIMSAQTPRYASS